MTWLPTSRLMDRSVARLAQRVYSSLAATVCGIYFIFHLEYVTTATSTWVIPVGMHIAERLRRIFNFGRNTVNLSHTSCISSVCMSVDTQWEVSPVQIEHAYCTDCTCMYMHCGAVPPWRNLRSLLLCYTASTPCAKAEHQSTVALHSTHVA